LPNYSRRAAQKEGLKMPQFEKKESYQHEYAKTLLLNWLIEGAMEFRVPNREGERIPGRRDTGVVVLSEYPLFDDPQLNAYFRDEECRRLGARPCKRTGESKCFDCTFRKRQCPEAKVTAVLDIVFGYKGSMYYAIEVQNSNPVSDEKLEVILAAGLTLIEVKADTIMCQVRKPKWLGAARIVEAG
jgi:hypothetical protein